MYASTPDWTYRYNFLYDNCTTRILDALKNASGARLLLSDGKSSATERSEQANPENLITLTYRQMIWKAAYSKSPWVAFGQDLLLGYEVDQTLNLSQAATFPQPAMIWASKATIIHADGRTENLVAENDIHMPTNNISVYCFFTPTVVALFVLLLSLVATILQWFGHKSFGRLFDNTTLLIQGLTGCIIAFMFFFSAQPSVDTNMLVWLFNPLPLLYLPIKIKRDAKAKPDYWMPYVQTSLIVITLATCNIIKGQAINTPMYLFIVSMLIRALFNCIDQATFRNKHLKTA